MWFFSKKSVDGIIGYFELSDWWLSTFSKDEQNYMIKRFQPMGSSGNALTEEKIRYTTQTVIRFLSSLASWFTKKEERVIAHKILNKAEELITKETPILDLHFLYHQLIKTYYKDRNQPKYYDKAIYACKKQISISEKAVNTFRREWGEDSLIPSHLGYKQLAIILEKEKKYDEVISLCTQASDQEWAGDWDKRIARCKKKIGK